MDDKEKTKTSTSRRNFLKKAIGGAAGLGAAAMIPSATGFEITSNQGLEFFDSTSSKPSFKAGNNGTIEANHLGTKNSLIDSINAKNVHSKSKSPNITVYEDDSGVAKAVTEEKTYNGEDIFDAAQKAIDSRLEEERPGIRDASNMDSGDVHVRFKPGYYSVSNRITITEDGTERIILESPGQFGCWVDTSNISDGKHVIEINPGPVDLGDWFQRNTGIEIDGLVLDHTKSNSKDADGLYINDAHVPYIRDSKFTGYGNALWIRNTWQGGIDNVWVNQSGRTDQNLNSNISGKPQIVIGAPSDTETHQAVNHLSIRHLQGDPAGMENTYFATYGRTTKCSIVYANVELNDQKGFQFNADAAWKCGWKIVNSHIPGGSPTMEINDGTIQVSNSEIGEVKQTSWAQSHFSNCVVHTDETAFDISQGNFYAQQMKLKNPDKGFDFSLSNEAVLNNIVINNCSKEAIVSGGGCQVMVNGLKTTGEDAHIEADYVIDHGSGDGSIYSDVVAAVDEKTDASENSIPLIRVSDVKGVSLDNLIPQKNVTEKVTEGYGNIQYYNNKGTSTVPTGNDRTTVNHKLEDSPSPQSISVTPISALGNATSWHISNISSTSFDIILDTDPGVDVRFSWQAEV